MKYQHITIEKFVHDSVLIASPEAVVYIDPFKLPADAKKATLVCITHEHFDHCSLSDIQQIITGETHIVAAASCEPALETLSNQIRYVAPGDVQEVNGVRVRAVPAYNVNKFREPGVPFHPKQLGMVGFVITVDDVRVYHAGDTDYIPEMMELKGIDVALLPVSGTYVMTAQEAVEAAETIGAALTIPMHYGDIVGTVDDAEEFCALYSGESKII